MSKLIVNNNNQNSSLRKSLLILISSLIIGIAFNLLFYKSSPGISVIIFESIFYFIFFIIFKSSFTKDLSFNNLIIIFIFLLSIFYTIFSNQIFRILNIMVIPLLILIHTILFSKKNTKKWFDASFIENVLYGFFYGAFAFIFKPITIISNTKVFHNSSDKNGNIKKILTGLLISFPLLIVIISLLSSADMVFSDMIRNFTKIFNNINIGDFIGRLILIIIVSALTFSYLWYLSIPNNSGGIQAGSTENKATLSFDPVIVITILISINAVYLLFTFVQFTYLFDSIGHNLPQNFTFAEYARRGFFELLVVTLINLTILLLTVSLTKSIGNKTSIFIKILNSFLVFCTGIMLFSAHFRMSLYEQTYGYTYLRVFTHSFMLYIFALLIIALVKVWDKKLIILKYYIIISLIAYTIINFMNVDSIIAKNNIERYHRTGKIDVSYLTMLSYDAVPQLLDFLPELKSKDSASAIKLENRLHDEKNDLNNNNNWQSFNFSMNKAKNSLAKHKLTYVNINPEIDIYK